MSRIDEIYIKPHSIRDLESPVEAPNIDDNFDRIFSALETIREAVNGIDDSDDSSSSTTTTGADEAFVMAMSGI
jgi:hypothetical protein